MVPRFLPFVPEHHYVYKEMSVDIYQTKDTSEQLQILNHTVSFKNPLRADPDPDKTLFDESTATMTITLRVRRQGYYYLMNFVYPLLVMWLLSYLTFFLSFEENDRVGIIMAVVWTVTAIMFLTAKERPYNFTDSWIDLFQAVTIILCVFPAVEAVLVSRLKTHIKGRFDLIHKTYEESKEKALRRMRESRLKQLHLELKYQSDVSPYDGYPPSVDPTRFQSTRIRKNTDNSFYPLMPSNRASVCSQFSPSQFSPAQISPTQTGNGSPSPATGNLTERSAYQSRRGSLLSPASPNMWDAYTGWESSEESTASETNEEEIEFPPPPDLGDPGALSNFIDRLSQILYPSIALAIMLEGLNGNSVHSFFIESIFGFGLSGQVNIGSRAMAIFVVTTFSFLWLIAICSYVRVTRNSHLPNT